MRRDQEYQFVFFSTVTLFINATHAVGTWQHKIYFNFWNEILPDSQARTTTLTWGLHLTDLGYQPRSTATRGTLPLTAGAETVLSPSLL